MNTIKHTLLLLAAALLPMSMGAQVINGDLNHNGDLDVEDITLLINGYLTGEKEYFDGGDDKVHEYVDLGLSVKWATMNIGANSPEDYGNYYAWGEITTKGCYDWSTYKWCNGSSQTLTKYCVSSSYGTVDNNTQLDLSDDAARVNWGGTWRMPTDAELRELKTKCKWNWTTQSGVYGYMLIGPNGNSIFLPAAGCRNGNSFISAGINGYYWSSSLDEFAPSPSYAWYVLFSSSGAIGNYNNRCFGYSVRAVCP